MHFKICSGKYGCGQSKPLSEFPLRKDSPDGRRNQCNECRNKYVSNWKKRKDEIKAEKERLNNPPKGFKYCRGEFGCGKLKPVSDFSPSKYNNDGHKSYCKDCDKLNKAADWEKNKDRYSVMAKMWRDDHSEEIREQQKQYRLDNKEHLTKKRKIYGKTHKDQIKVAHQIYYTNNKDAFYERKAIRRARKVGVEEHFTSDHRCIVTKCFGGKCFSCGSTENLCIDHHRPLSKGYALTLSNAVVLCKECNSEKHDKMPEDFYGHNKCLELDIMLLMIEYLYG